MTRPVPSPPATLLYALVRLPLLSAPEYARLARLSPRAARAHLASARRVGLVGAVHVATLPPRLALYYLTAAGVGEAARLAGTPPERLIARYALGEAAIAMRLPAVGRLLGGRDLVLQLEAALTIAGGELRDWRAWPVRWHYTAGTQERTVLLDGELVLRLPGQRDEWRLGLLWDGNVELPRQLLHDTLTRVEEARAAPEYRPPCVVRVPPVLLVTHDAERVPPGYYPGVLWTTTAEIADHGFLYAGWHSGLLAGGAAPRPLARALAAQVGERNRGTPGDVLGRGSSRLPATALQAHVDAAGRRPDGPTSLREACLLAARLPGSAWELLVEIGQHPLLAADELATALLLHPVAVRTELGWLCQDGLVRAWHPRTLPPVRRRGVRLVRRHILTPWATTLLAARAGVAPAAYRAALGLLDDRPQGRGRGFMFLTGTLAHTDLVNCYYLALRQAIRATGGRLDWRGEWACTASVTVDGHRATLRPDAAVTVTDGQGAISYFLEVDRGTESADTIAGKLALYAAYRADAGLPRVSIFFLCTKEARCRMILTCGWRQADPPSLLDLRVTTVDRLDRHGPLAAIWYEVADVAG